MSENTKKHSTGYYEVNLLDIFSILNTHKFLIIFFTLIGVIYSIFYALNIDKIYISEAKLLTSSSGLQSNRNNQGDMSGVLSIFGGGSTASLSKGQEAEAFIRSRTFFKILYQNDEFLGDLFAIDSYNISTKNITYDQLIYNSKDNIWKEKISFEEAYYHFHNGIFSIDKNLQSGIYNLKFKSISPHIASKWLNEIIEEINEFIKLREVKHSEKKITFYESKISEEQMLSLRSLLLNNLQSELQVIAYSKATDEFAFSVIDYPNLPERPSEPSRSIIVMLGSIISFLIVIFSSVLYHFFYFNRN